MSRLDIGVAVAVPEPFAAVLAGWRDRVGDPEGKRVPPHVTLLPPTAVESERVGEVERHLAAAAAASDPFDLHLSGTGTFRPVSDVVFVVVVAGASHCARLERLVRCGPLDRETRFPYHPHVTVAHDIDQAALDLAYAGLADFDARFPVSGFTLFERGSDSVWQRRRVFVLGGQAAERRAAPGRGTPGAAAPNPLPLTAATGLEAGLGTIERLSHPTLEPTTLEPTTLEPTTLEPTTLEPTTLEPTTGVRDVSPA